MPFRAFGVFRSQSFIPKMLPFCARIPALLRPLAHWREKLEILHMSEPDSQAGDTMQDSLILNEVQLLLSEKRTSFSTLRTGIAIFAFPLSVLSLLIATSRYYEPKRVLYFLVPLGLINAVLVALGSYLIVTSIRRARHYDRHILDLKRQHSRLAALLD